MSLKDYSAVKEYKLRVKMILERSCIMLATKSMDSFETAVAIL